MPPYPPPPPPQKKSTKSQNPKNSSVLSLNIRGLIPGTRRDKLTFLSSLANESEAEIIMITESHLSPKICDSEVNLPGWGLARGDRETRQSGGSLIYYKDQMTALHEKSHSNSYVDTVMIYTPLTDSAWISVYRPPNCPNNKFIEAMEVIQEWTTKLERSLEKTPNIYLAGDFNMPTIRSWDHVSAEDTSHSATSGSNNLTTVGANKEQVLRLAKFASDWSLTQEIKENTHAGNILDLLFTNNTNSIESVEITEKYPNL